jgi:zinc/manganese transport system substrate-binding protein
MKSLNFIACAVLALFVAGASPAAAKVDVVAANQDLAWVTQSVGGNLVSVDYIARGDQDPHQIEPRPSQVVKLAHADLLVRIGMDLDLWLDSLIRASGNGKISASGRGYVDASRNIKALEVPTGKLDPSKGDIHIYGNPHYLFAPTNLRVVARNVADGLERVDPGNKAAYEANYAKMMDQLQDQLKKWSAQLAGDKGKPVVTYHRSLGYFLNEFGLKDAGNVEPRPGLEPTPGHVNSLANDMKSGNVKVIIAENFRPRRYSDLLARLSGAKLVVIPAGVGAEKGINDYWTFIGTVVNRVAEAL